MAKKTNTTKKFEVQGTVMIGSREMKFSKTLEAFNEKHATEKTLSLFGSKNKVKRRNIHVNHTAEVRDAK